jgi:hypothetical protein
MIKESANELGANYFELFTSIIVNRTYADVMDKDKSMNTKTRLGAASKFIL